MPNIETDIDDGVLFPRVPEGRAFNVASLIGTLLFLAIVLCTFFADTVWRRDLPKLEGIEKVDDRALRVEAAGWEGFKTGRMAALFDHDFRVRSQVRHAVLPTYAFYLFRYLNEAKPSTVILGKENWLFMPQRVRPRDEPIVDILHMVQGQLDWTERFFSDHGVRLILAPIPRKAVVAQKFLPRTIDPIPEIDQRLVPQLRANGLEAPDLFSLFKKMDPNKIWFPLDTHWCDLGALEAAKEIVTYMGSLSKKELRKSRIVPMGTTTRPLSDLFSRMGIEFEPDDPILKSLPSRDVFEAQGLDGGRLQTKLRSMPNTLLVGTSFSGGRGFLLFLRHFLNQPIWRAAHGGDPFFPLTEFLESHTGPFPRTTILEIPNHFLFDHRRLAGFNSFAAKFAPSVVPIFTHMTKETTLGHRINLTNHGIAVIRENVTILHNATGALGIRLRGHVTGDNATVVVNCGKGKPLQYTWNVGQEEIVLPALANSSTKKLLVVLRQRPPAKKTVVTLTSAEVVVPSKAATETQVKSVIVQGEDSPTFDFVFPHPASNPRGIVVIDLPKGCAGKINVQAKCANGQFLTLLTGNVTRNRSKMVVVELRRTKGHKVDALRLSLEESSKREPNARAFLTQ